VEVVPDGRLARDPWGTAIRLRVARDMEQSR
jgi:hypothetical protein